MQKKSTDSRWEAHLQQSRWEVI